MSVKYSRSFITLTEYDNLNSKYKYSGKALVELKNEKCNLFIWLQNLESKLFYNIYFIYIKDNRRIGIYITDIYVGEDGNSELKYNFNLDDVFEKSFAVNDFVAIAVVFEKENKTPLIGFKKNSFVWDNSFAKMHFGKNKHIDAEFIKNDTYVNENILHNDLFKLKDELSNEKNKEEKKDEPDLNIGGLENLFDDSDISFAKYILNFANDLNKTAVPEIGSKTDNKKDNSKNILIKLIKNKKEIQPFTSQNREVNWKTIKTEDLYPIKKMEKLLKNKMISNAYDNNHHFILGYVKDFNGADYYFGVPDIYDRNIKDDMYKLGFIQFKCVIEQKPTQQSEGYWIMKL